MKRRSFLGLVGGAAVAPLAPINPAVHQHKNLWDVIEPAVNAAAAEPAETILTPEIIARETLSLFEDQHGYTEGETVRFKAKDTTFRVIETT